MATDRWELVARTRSIEADTGKMASANGCARADLPEMATVRTRAAIGRAEVFPAGRGGLAVGGGVHNCVLKMDTCGQSKGAVQEFSGRCGAVRA